MGTWDETARWPIVSQRKLAAWRKLASKKGRGQAGEIIVEGVRLVGEALVSDQETDAVLVADGPNGLAAAKRLAETIPDWNGEIYRIGRRDLDRLVDVEHSPGIAAVIRWRHSPFPPDPNRNPKRLLICDRLSDPGNLGTLIRTAAGLGLDAVVTTVDTVELTNPKTIRATAGACFRIPICEHVAHQSIAQWCRENQLPLLVADAHRGDSPSPPTERVDWALVIGGETIPQDPVWDTISVERIRLPLARGVESLNAAVAGAILMDRLCRTTAVAARRPT